MADLKPAAGRAPARRRFLGWLWAALGLTALAESAWITASFLRPRRGRGDETGLMTAGPIDDFAPGSVTAFPAGRFHLVRLADGGFLALHRECTHLGCTIPWSVEQQRFACPCHASSFDITGAVLSPPAPRPLDMLAVRIENGLVKVDPSSRRRRDRFDPSQAVQA